MAGRRALGRAAAAALCLALGAPPARAGEAPKAPPRRVASLNVCADELVLRLADPGQVVSVTWLARDPRSSGVADLARDVAVNRGLAEEIVPLKPDLVVAGAYTTHATTAMLRRLGIEVMELGVPTTLAEATAQVRDVAARLGVPARGEDLARKMAAAMAPPVVPPPPATAIVLRPNGFTAGPGSLPDAAMAAAGLDNLAARLPADSFGQLTLEQIVTAQPDLLVVNGEKDAPPSLADDLLNHRALAGYRNRRVEVPLRLWSCAGPDVAQAVARLSAAPRPGRVP